MEESKRIKVYLNGNAIEVFKGMKVKHILTHTMVHDIRNGRIIITDKEGHERGLEGSLCDGEYLKIQAIGKIP
jgi:hypothetical protein